MQHLAAPPDPAASTYGGVFWRHEGEAATQPAGYVRITTAPVDASLLGGWLVQLNGMQPTLTFVEGLVTLEAALVEGSQG